MLNVEENITLPLLLDGRKVDKAFLNDLTGTLGLRERLRHLPNQLSGGQQQRVSIGRALINSPSSSWPTSRPAIWTVKTAPKSSAC